MHYLSIVVWPPMPVVRLAAKLKVDYTAFAHDLSANESQSLYRDGL